MAVSCIVERSPEEMFIASSANAARIHLPEDECRGWPWLVSTREARTRIDSRETIPVSPGSTQAERAGKWPMSIGRLAAGGDEVGEVADPPDGLAGHGGGESSQERSVRSFGGVVVTGYKKVPQVCGLA